MNGIFTHFFLRYTLLLFGIVIHFSSHAFSLHAEEHSTNIENNCAGCNSTEFSIVRFFLGDANGSQLAATCNRGDTIAAFLWMQVNQAQIRYSLALNYSYTITKPGGATSVAGDSVCLFVGQAIPLSLIQIEPVQYYCGDEWTITQMEISWKNNANDSCGFEAPSCRCMPSAQKVQVPLSISLNKIDEFCPGSANGSANVQPTGGIAPYTYAWSGGQTTQTISNLGFGNYSVTVTDSVGTIISQTFSIGTIADSVQLNFITEDASCYGSASGNIFLSPTSGQAPFNYQWNTGATSQNLIGVSAGNYIVTVTDSNGCVWQQAFVIQEPDSISINITTTDVSCNGFTDGSAQITATGGVGGYVYMWSNGSTSSFISGVSAGIFTVTVTDSLGCSATASVTVLEPVQLSASLTQINVSCFGLMDGSASITTVGGTGPYTYVWSTTPPQTTANAINLAAGTYTVAVTDTNGCTLIDSIIILEPDSLVASATASDVFCYGTATGTAQAAASGGTPPYSYFWNNGDTSSTASGLEAGSYLVTATDANGCAATTTIVVEEPALLQLSTQIGNPICWGANNGFATVFVSGGTAPYQYLWSTNPPQTGATAQFLSAGEYSIAVTDANGCLATSTVVLSNPPVGTPCATILDSNLSSITTLYLDTSGIVNIALNPQHYHPLTDSVYFSRSHFNCGDLGNTIPVTLSITNKSTQPATTYYTANTQVIVLDTLKPILEVPSQKTIYLNSQGQKQISFFDIVTGISDNCSLNLSSVVFTPKSLFACTDVGNSIVSVSIADSSGNVALRSFTLVVVDSIAPSITLHTDTVFLQNGTITLGFADLATANDTCGIDTSLINNAAQISFNCQNTGAQLVSLSATDLSGNSTIKDFYIYVVDTQQFTYQITPAVVYLTQGTTNITPSDFVTINTAGCTTPILTTIGDTTFGCANLSSNPNYVTFNLSIGTQSIVDSVMVTVLDTTGFDYNFSPQTVYLQNGSTNISLSGVITIQTNSCFIPVLAVLSDTSFTCADASDTVFVKFSINQNNKNITDSVPVWVVDTAVLSYTLNPQTIYLQGNDTLLPWQNYLNIQYSGCDTVQTQLISGSLLNCTDIGQSNYLVIEIASGSFLATDSLLITLIDSVPPVIHLKSDTLFLVNNSATLTFANIDNGTMDNCGVDSVLINGAQSLVFNCSNAGTVRLGIEAWDINGNYSVDSVTIYILDNAGFTYTHPPITAYLIADSVVVNNFVQVQTTSCIMPLINQLSSNAFFCTDVNQTRYIKFNITNGNVTVTDSTMVLVLDTVKPLVALKTDTVYINNGQAQVGFVQVDNGSVDNCGISQALLNGQSLLTFSCGQLGLQTISVSVTDASGNTATGNTSVFVADTATPVYNKTPYTAYLAGSSVSVSRSNIISNLFWGCNPTASLNLTSDSVFNCSDVFNNPHYITFEITNGLSTIVDSVPVTVLDTVKPTLNPKIIAILALNSSGVRNLSPLDVLNVIPTDNCGIDSIIISPAQITCANTTSYISVSITAIDNSGNSRQNSVLVLAQDVTPPQLTTQATNLYLDSLTGSATLTNAQVVLSATDACGIGTTTLGKTNFTCADLGNSNVLVTISDVNNNQSATIVPITVLDTVAPYFNLLSQLDVYLNTAGQAQIAFSNISASTPFDACGVSSILISQTDFDCSWVGSHTISVTLSDASGNTRTKTITVNVLDTISPTLVTKNHSVFINPTTQVATISAADVIQSAMDNCGMSANVIVSPNIFTCAQLGINTVMVTVFDVSGNSKSMTAQVEVLDNPPTTLTISGLSQVCRNEFNVKYTPANLDTNLTYTWIVSGGSVVSTGYRGHEIYIHWTSELQGNLEMRTHYASACTPSIGTLVVNISGLAPDVSTIEFWGNSTQNTLVILDQKSTQFQWGYDVFIGGQRISTTLLGQTTNSYYNTQIVSNINNLGYIYWCDASLDGQCWQRSYFGNAFPVSVEEMPESKIIIYPNPFLDVLRIETPTAKKIMMTDARGQLISIDSFEQNGIIIIQNMDNLPAGMYFINIEHSNGNRTQHKLVKSK